MAEVRRIVARWPMVERRGGADDGGATTHERSDLRRHGAARRAVRQLLQAAAFGTDGGPWVRRPVDTEVFTPLPQAGDRRAHLQRLMGAEPLWWQGLLHHDGRQAAGQVAVYLDVSGSMTAWLPVLLEALTESAALVQWPLFGFSTQVHPVTRTELAAGRFRAAIDVFPEEPCNNKLAGNVVDLCPVGALCSKDFLYKKRVWWLKQAESVCTGCSTGCSISIDQNENKVYRLRPRPNPEAQGHFMCDEGRFGFKYIHDERRLSTPRLSVALASGIESQRKTTSANFAPDLNFADLWPTALTKARQKIQDAIKADPSSFVAVFSPFMTVEEAYLLAKFIKGIHDKARLVLGPVPSVGVDDKYPKGPKGESPADGNVKFTIRAEKCPNRLGVEAVLKHFEGSVVRIESIAQRPNAHAWYIVGGYTSGWVTEAIDKAIGTPSLLIVQDIFPSPLSERADIVLASGSFAERDGTYVNHAGLAQSASAAVRAPGEARADGRILMELAGRTGLFNAMALRKEIGAAIPELSVLGSGDLGDQGVRLVRFAKQATAAAT